MKYVIPGFFLYKIWKVVKSLLEAKSSGFSDVLFLDAATGKNIEEISTCNIFILKVKNINTYNIKFQPFICMNS